MECEAAFKTSFRKDTSLKFTPQPLLDDLAFNLQNVAPSDDFSVDDLLDFSHEDALQEEEQQQQQQQQQQRKDASVSVSVSVSPQQPDQSRDFSSLITSFSAKDEFVSSELTFPAVEEADLEWLSHFVEDSFLEYPAAAYPAATSTEKNPNSEKVLEPETPVSTPPCFRAPVPAKARSKRTRTGVRVWPLGSPSFAESSSSPSSSSSSSLSGSWLIFATQNLDQVNSPAAKKPRKKQASEADGSGGAPAPAPRRCSHCGVQKTPQWRTGPLGAKTLCNACGVRYKSGRLLPEYRPACSPTFSSELHSNHHRKVLEMRQKKEVMSGIGSGLDHSPAVPSF